MAWKLIIFPNKNTQHREENSRQLEGGIKKNVWNNLRNRLVSRFNLVACIIVTMMIFSAIAYANNYIFTVFQDQTPISAEEVNNNFNYLKELTFGENGTKYYFNKGNVGFGIADPLADLHLKGTAANNKTLLVDDEASNPNTLFTVLRNGNVGIGTASPAGKLHVNGCIETHQIGRSSSVSTIFTGDVNVDMWRWWRVGTDNLTSWGLASRTLSLWGYPYNGLGGASQQLMGFTFGSPSKMFISAPVLDITGTTNANQINATGFTNSGTTTLNGTTNAKGIFSENIWATGIHLNGGSGGIWDSAQYWRIYAYGNIFLTGSVTAASDRRYKKNIVTLKNTLGKICSLRGVQYNYNRDQFPKHGFPAGTHIGLIGQELEKVFPELVVNNKEGYKAVTYDKITAILIEAIKELRSEKDKAISRLENENHQLTKICKETARENETLKKRFELLETRLNQLEKGVPSKQASVVSMGKSSQNEEDGVAQKISVAIKAWFNERRG